MLPVRALTPVYCCCVRMLEARSCHLLVTVVFIHFVQSGALQIPLGSKLSVAKNESWVSSNGNFALGFFYNSIHRNRHSIGIRFNSILNPSNEQTLVWVAGAGISVGSNDPDSYFQLTEGGELVLFDSLKGDVVWSTNTCNSSVSSACLLDDGNLVLYDQDRNVVWQSFRTPSDTLLPGQNLTLSQSLRAASRNSISSYYTLSMDTFGQLKLSWEANVTYWKTDVSSARPIWDAAFTKEGAFQLLDTMSRSVWSVYGDDHNDTSVSFRFLRLDADGNLRMYSWAEDAKAWRSVWQAVANQCDVFATCGLSGVCAFNQSGHATCKCPFESSSSSSSDCLVPYYQECSSGSSMVALEHTLLYGIYPPEDLVVHSSAEQCKNSCLQDSNCTAVTVTNDGEAQCRIKKTRFVTGLEYPSLPSISFVRICLDPIAAAFPIKIPASPPPSTPSHAKPYRYYVYLVIGLASGTVGLVLMIQGGILFYILKKRKGIESTGAANCPSLYSIGMISLSYLDIKEITGNFKHRLGPHLYKGMLGTNQAVVVKELKLLMQSTMAVDEKLFKSRIAALGGIHHKNLVKLEGYCCDSGRRFLVFEFHKNTSVGKWIKGAKLSRKLTWRKRIDICIGVAKAISYLHFGCREFISHGNLKWENVLLDEDLEAKVSEFGLARVSGAASQGGKEAEEDVAMFGEMIVEIVTGCYNGAGTCSWAYREWVQGHGLRVVDSRAGDKISVDEVERMLRIAFWCVQSDARLRPSVGEVLKVLQGTLCVDPPPPPYPD